jgi:hypothetical protein
MEIVYARVQNVFYDIERRSTLFRLHMNMSVLEISESMTFNPLKTYLLSTMLCVRYRQYSLHDHYIVGIKQVTESHRPRKFYEGASALRTTDFEMMMITTFHCWVQNSYALVAFKSLSSFRNATFSASSSVAILDRQNLGISKQQVILLF